MSSALLRRLVIGLGALVALWLIAAVLRRDPEGGSATFAIPAVDTAQVDSIVVEGAEGRLAVRRTAAGWAVNGYRADSGAVADLLGVFGAEAPSDLVAMNPASHERLEVDAADGRRLRVYQNGDLKIDLIVGKRGTSFQDVYVRRPDEDQVHQVEIALAAQMDRKLDGWRDKTLARIEADSVGEVVIRRGSSEITLRREADSTWSVNGEPADSAEVRQLLEEFAALDASGFPTEAQRDSVDFAAAEREVAVWGRASHVLFELTLDSASTGFWARVSGDSVTYRLDRYRANQVTPSDSTLREVTPER